MYEVILVQFGEPS